MTPEVAALIREKGGDPTPPKGDGLDVRAAHEDSGIGVALVSFSDMLSEREPGRALLELVRHGPAVAAELLEEFRVFLRGRGQAEAAIDRSVRGLLRLVHDQYSRRVIDWKPEDLPTPPDRRRLVVYLGPQVDDQLRLLCAKLALPLSRVVENALAAELTRLEAEPRFQARREYRRVEPNLPRRRAAHDPSK